MCDSCLPSALLAGSHRLPGCRQRGCVLWVVTLLLCRPPLDCSSHARRPVLVCTLQTAPLGLTVHPEHSVSVACAVQAAAQGLPTAPAAGQHGAGSCCLWQVQHGQGVLGGCRGVGRAPAPVRPAGGLCCPARLHQPAARHQGGLRKAGPPCRHCCTMSDYHCPARLQQASSQTKVGCRLVAMQQAC